MDLRDVFNIQTIADTAGERVYPRGVGYDVGWWDDL